MADNSAMNATDTYRSKDRAGVKTQIVGVDIGIGTGTEALLSPTNPLPVGGGSASTSTAIAVGTPATAGPLAVSQMGNVTFSIKNTTAGSAWAGSPVIVFEQSDDGTSWSPLYVVRNDTGQVGSTFTLGAGVANAELQFDGALEGAASVRARVTTAPTTNGLTVVITAGGFLTMQGGSAFAAPLDGQKATFCANTGTGAALVPHVALTGPFLIVNNNSTTKNVRLLRLRLELTIATAAQIAFYGMRQAAPTGGTPSSLAVGLLDTTEASAIAAPAVYTATPTTASAATAVFNRRLWVGLTTAAGTPYVSEITWGSGRPSKGLLLRPGQVLGVHWVAAPATAVALTPEVEWTEEPV